MPERRSIKLATAARNRALVTLLLERKVPFAVAEDGTVRYSSRFDEVVDADILSSLRRRVFSKWQVVSFPPEWAGVYRGYMRQNKIRFAPEWVNGRLVYLIPASHRPHDWDLPDPPAKRKRRAAALASG